MNYHLLPLPLLPTLPSQLSFPSLSSVSSSASSPLPFTLLSTSLRTTNISRYFSVSDRREQSSLFLLPKHLTDFMPAIFCSFF